MNPRPKVYGVNLTATPVSVPPMMWVVLHNVGNPTIYVNVTGGPAATNNIGDNIKLEAGDSMVCPPLGLSEVSAIGRVDSNNNRGRILVMSSEEPPKALPSRSYFARIARGFTSTAVGDGDTVVYDIATDFIASSSGGRVTNVILYNTGSYDAWVRFEIATSGSMGPDFVLHAGDSKSFDGIELISSIHARNVTAGQNFTIEGEVMGH